MQTFLNRLKRVFVPILLISLVLVLFPQPTLYATTRGRVFTLDNGLNVFIKEVHTSPVVAVNIFVRSGIRYEAQGESGYSRLLERLLFAATPQNPSGQIDRKIKKLAARRGSFTTQDYSCFYATGASEHFHELLSLQADAFLNSSFNNEDFEKARKESLSMIESLPYSPKRYLYEITRSVAYSIHPYRNSYFGSAADLASATRDKLYEFYTKSFVPSNSWVVIIGSVETEKALESVRSTLGEAPRATPPTLSIPSEPPQDRTKEHRQFGSVDQVYLNMAWHAPGINSPDRYVLDILAKILASKSHSRLARALGIPRIIAHDFGAVYYTSFDPTLFIVHGRMNQGNVRAFLRTVKEQMKLLAETDTDPSELERVRQMVIAENIFSRETVEAQAFTYGHYAVLSDVFDADLYIHKINQVTQEDLRRVASETFTDMNLTIASLEPRPQPEIKPEMLTLENGLRLIIKESHASPLVAMSICIDAGTLREGSKDAGLAYLTLSTLLKGTGKKSTADVNSEFASMGTKVSVVPGDSFVTINMLSLTEYFIPSMELLLELIKNPEFPASEIQQHQERALEKIREEESQLYSFSLRRAVEKLFPDSYLSRSFFGAPDSVARHRRSDIQDFHKRFYIPNNMIVSVVGNIFPRNMKPFLVERFETFSRGRTTEFKPPALAAISEPIVVENRKNRTSAKVILASRAFPAKDPRSLHLQVVSTILSLGEPNRLASSLEKAGIQFASVNSSLARGTHHGFFNVGAAVSVSSYEKAAELLLEELNKIVKSGFTQTEVEEAVAFLVGEHSMKLLTNLGQAERFSSDEMLGLGFDYYTKFPELLQGTSLDMLASVSAEIMPKVGSSSHVISITRP